MKKNFFELLSPGYALLVGVATAFLGLGTIGFFVFGSYLLKNGIIGSAPSAQYFAVDNPAQPNQPPAAPVPTVPKAKRPKIELFVMSYCPFGLQVQKAMVPAWALLGDKADIDVKFVSYAMHGQKEVEENTRQFCIQKQSLDTYRAYLDCFTKSGSSETCLQQARVNQSQLTKCTQSTDAQFGITKAFNDRSSWLSGQYPVYPIHQTLNNQYGVQGSPTLVVNGTAVDTGRSPQDLKNVICAAFTNPPAECSEALSTVAYQPGFGATLDSSGANAAVQCGS